jgi:hypothetical protein
VHSSIIITSAEERREKGRSGRWRLGPYRVQLPACQPASHGFGNVNFLELVSALTLETWLEPPLDMYPAFSLVEWALIYF